MEEKTYTGEELYEFRKVLVDWKWKGPEAILVVLGLLHKSNLQRDALLASKIYKTVHTLRENFKKPNWNDLVLYNRDQVRSIQLKLKGLHNQIKELVTKKPRKDPTVFQVTKPLYSDYLPSEQRERFRNKLIDYLLKLRTTKAHQHCFNDEAYQFQQKATDFCTRIENAIYDKHYGQVSAQANYMADLKTLYKYLQKDQSGQILQNLFDGIFPLEQAIQLHLRDWLADDQLREIERRRKSEDYDANYYSQLRVNVMIQSKGMECPKCHNNYLYLIDEKQLRRADEPATLFYECFACQHRYKV